MLAEATDVLVIGGGPAALCIASELHQRGVVVEGIAPHPVHSFWPNTYGIWARELELLGLDHLLEHRWSKTCSFFGSGGSPMEDQPTWHGIDYGLLNRRKLQQYWLGRCSGMTWHQDSIVGVVSQAHSSVVETASGDRFQARLVIDATGHRNGLVRRPDRGPVAGQAAYGVVGRFNKPPVKSGQFVLMDFRCDHLKGEQRDQPPTFLYAMDFGKGVYFLEETSLALAPPVPEAVLKQRLHQRLAHSV